MSLKQRALLVALLNQMQKHGSWCGETQIQKTVYFGKELSHLPFEYEFILYKHGPFSFDLRDELVSMQADDLLRQAMQPYPYGPSFVPGGLADTVLARFPQTIKQYSPHMAFLAKEIGKKKVAELEKIATALFITKQHGNISERARARALTDVKPHITRDEAVEAVRVVDKLAVDAEAAIGP
jgi:hypothetical protein